VKKIALFVCLLATVVHSAAFGQSGKEGNGKDYGVAMNPVLALFGWFSGEFNVWKLDRTGEINVPVMFIHNPFYIDRDDYSLDLFMVGSYYRKFFDARQEGFFVQGGANYFHASVSDDEAGGGASVSTDQGAVLFGVGYRAISQTNGLFWACGIAAGRAVHASQPVLSFAHGEAPRLSIEASFLVFLNDGFHPLT
jgi:hypothetical protein